MGLREYRRKRDFSVTPEPAGAERPPGGRSFVVQKHAASRLHYDFRLELEGVLKSWAVPKGPSLDPADKRLAMQTEDHPVEYGDFEGVIPAGEYGGGTVVVWDRGTWEPVGDPHADYRKGRMKFRLHGSKLRGGFALVRVRGRDRPEDERGWLLIKERDAEARPGVAVVEAEPRSVVSDRTLEEVARDRDRVWHSNRDEGKERSREKKPAAPATGARQVVRARAAARGSRRGPAAATVDLREMKGARRGALPAKLEPQLATLVSSAPTGEEWLHELKFDGYRILGRLARAHARLVSRGGLDWTARLPEIASAVEALPARALLVDGEAAVLLPDGTTSFQALQNRMSGSAEGRLVYYLFDVVHLDGYDLAAVPLEHRKEALRDLLRDVPADGILRYSDHVVGDGPEFHARACRLSLEGVVSKRRDAAYTPGRGRDWVKAKCLREQEVVIGGFTPPDGARVGLGALLVGVHDETGSLRYAGKVGTGFSAATLRDLLSRLEKLEQKTPPFAGRVTGVARARFVRPEPVAQVAFTEWTADGRLRHPSFRGLREDKPAGEVGREKVEPAPRSAAPAADRKPARSGEPGRKGRDRPDVGRGAPLELEGVRLTHPGRVLFPASGTTKEDLARFYVGIAGWILPHLRGRPTTLVRCPDGLAGECFYQKHAGHWAPESLRRVHIQEAKKVGEYLVVDDVRGLVGLSQLGILEIHTWNADASHLEQPDRLVFDLDPDSAVPWERVVAAARRVRERLLELDLESFVKTTGGKGLHVVVPLQRGAGWDESGRFAAAVAAGIAREEPEGYVAEMSKAKRRGRIFIDYLRNYRGSTSVAAYSTRARGSAPVSTPLRWDELAPTLSSDAFTIATLPARLEALAADPWADYRRVRQSLTATRLRTAGAA